MTSPIPDWLQVAQAIASLVVAIATVASLLALVIYVAKTAAIANETARAAAATEIAARATERSSLISEQTLAEIREARQAQAAPYIVAYFDEPFGDLAVHLVVKNVGRSAAHDVRLRFDPPLVSKWLESLNYPLPAFVTGAVPLVPPAYELRAVLWPAEEALGDHATVSPSHRVGIEYMDSQTGRRHSGQYVLDFSALRDRMTDVVTTLRDLNATLQDVVKHQATIAAATTAVQTTLSGGVLIANSSLLVESLPVSADPEAQARAKLGELVALWRARQMQEERIRFHPVVMSDTGARLGVMRAQLLRMAAQVTDRCLTEQLQTANGILLELLVHRHYASGGQTHRAYDATGDRMLELVSAEAVTASEEVPPPPDGTAGVQGRPGEDNTGC